MRLSHLSRLIFAAALALPGAAALADPLYNVTVIGGLGSTATGINRYGDVVGSITSSGASTASGNTHAFVFSGGSLHDLGTLGGSGSVAWDINNHGVIVGSANTGTEPDPYYKQAFRYEGGGTVNKIGAPELGNSAIYAYNDLGQAVGGIPASAGAGLGNARPDAFGVA